MTEPTPIRAVQPRCVLDSRQPGRPAAVGRVCADHHARLGELLDPRQRGQMFVKPGERRVPPSIEVLYSSLDAGPVRRSLDSQVVGASFGSRPPGRLEVMALRDPRSTVGDGRDDHEGDVHLSVLGTLAAIAVRLDVRDIDGRPVQWPHEPVELAKWLHARLDRLCGEEWVADAWYDLRRLHAQLLDAVGEQRTRSLGPCQKRVDADGHLDPHGTVECGFPLYMPPQPLKGFDEYGIEWPEKIFCNGCRGTYDRAAYWALAKSRGVTIPADPVGDVAV